MKKSTEKKQSSLLSFFSSKKSKAQKTPPTHKKKKKQPVLTILLLFATIQPIIMTEPMNSLLAFTKKWGFVGRHKVFPDDVLPLVFAFLWMLKVFVISSKLAAQLDVELSYSARMEARLGVWVSLKKF